MCVYIYTANIIFLSIGDEIYLSPSWIFRNRQIHHFINLYSPTEPVVPVDQH